MDKQITVGSVIEKSDRKPLSLKELGHASSLIAAFFSSDTVFWSHRKDVRVKNGIVYQSVYIRAH